MENVKGNFNMVACTLKKKAKWWNENKTHHNACNSCRTSSTMKHEDFH
jgi:Zn ribbon nucleic-acid-binding protein